MAGKSTVLILSLLFAILTLGAGPATGTERYLSDLTPLYENNIHQCLQFDTVYWQPDIVIDGVVYAKGIGMHPPHSSETPDPNCAYHKDSNFIPRRGRAAWDLGGKYTTFLSRIALSEEAGREYPGSDGAIFRVYLDDRLIYESVVINFSTPPIDIALDVSGGSILILDVDSRGEHWGDHAVWANARLQGEEIENNDCITNLIALHDSATDVALSSGLNEPKIQQILDGNIGSPRATVTFDGIAAAYIGPGQFDNRLINQGVILEGISGTTQVGGTSNSGPISGGGMDVSVWWQISRIRAHFVIPGTTIPTAVARVGAFTTTEDAGQNCMEFYDKAGNSLGVECMQHSPWYPATTIEFLGGAYYKGIAYVDIYSLGIPFEVDLLTFGNYTADMECRPSGCVQPPSGMTGWWPGDGNANDIAGGNNGTLTGGATFAPGIVGQALNLNGNGYVRVADQPSLDTPDGFTVDAWIYPRALGGARVIASKWDDPTGQWSWIFKLHNDGTGRLRIEISHGDHNALGDLGGATRLPLNTWSHVAATYDRQTSRLRLYVNGRVDSEGAARFPGVAVNNSATDVLIGAVNGQIYPYASEHFSGLIDEIELFNRALTAEEIKSIYAAGSVGKCKDSAPAADAGPDRVVECKGPDGTPVELNGSGSSDPDGDALTYAWAWPGGSAEGVAPTITLPYSTTTVTLTVDDGKGGTDTDDVSVTVQDTTPPETTAIVAGVTGQNGWYVSDVTVTLNATDTCTGVKEIHYTVNGSETVVAGSTASFTLSRDGTYLVTYWAVDKAGREGARGMTPVKREVSPPVTTPILPPPPDDGNGYYRSCVPVTLSAEAGVSGVSRTEYSVDGGRTWIAYTGQFTVCGEGPTMITYRTTSNAGNIEQPKNLIINIDKTPPIITASVSPAANANGWHNTDVTVTFTCSDATSGIADCPAPVTVTTEGPGQVICGTAVDKAGNSTRTCVTLNIDKTAPSANISLAPGLLWPPNHKMVNVAVKGGSSDITSGVASVVFTVKDEYGTVQPMISGFNTTISLEAWREGTDRDGRQYTITAVITDTAGNSTTVTSEALCPHDMRDK